MLPPKKEESEGNGDPVSLQIVRRSLINFVMVVLGHIEFTFNLEFEMIKTVSFVFTCFI